MKELEVEVWHQVFFLLYHVVGNEWWQGSIKVKIGGDGIDSACL